MVYIIKDEKILLALKQRGIGAGMWMGYGGKFDLELDQSINDTALRELKEETAEIICTKKDLEPHALINFTLKTVDKDYLMQGFMYRLSNYSGNIRDTEEMKNPTWFPLNEIPYENMLVDNQVFLPLILKGEHFTLNITTEDGVVIKSNFTKKTQQEIQQIFMQKV